MNVSLAALVGISIYRMLVMQPIKFGHCDHCFRRYLLELMIVAKNDGPHLCIKCFNKDTRDKDQGFKAQALINQDSRAGQFISCEKKAQGSRVKP